MTAAAGNAILASALLDIFYDPKLLAKPLNSALFSVSQRPNIIFIYHHRQPPTPGTAHHPCLETARQGRSLAWGAGSGWGGAFRRAELDGDR